MKIYLGTTAKYAGLPEDANARDLTGDQLSVRFNLRVIATQLGILSDPNKKEQFLAMSTVDQARFLYDVMHPSTLEPLVREMNEARMIDEYRRACGELAKIMRLCRRR